MKQCLVTRPEHDDTTHYLSHWAKLCIDIAKSKGITVIDLWRDRANSKEVLNIVSKQKPSLILLNGHGSESTVTGHKNEPLFVAGKNEELLRDKIVYALSCQSAKVLGKKSVESGTKAYIGYEDDFIFSYDPLMITRPTEDATAKLFFAPSNELVISLLKGHTAEESKERSQDMYKRSIRQLLSSEASKDDVGMVRYLWWDMKNQVCLGDKDATFE